MSEQIELQVHIGFDEESERWYIVRSDVPGLRLEADSAAELIQRIEEAAPELIELNAEREQAKERPALRWRPVFDSSLELARA